MQMMEDVFTTVSPGFCLALAKLCCVSPTSASMLMQIHLEQSRIWDAGASSTLSHLQHSSGTSVWDAGDLD